LAPRLLVEQLRALEEPAPLVLAPRRQPRRLNSQFGYLGEAAEVALNPLDATAAGVLDGQDVVVRSAHGELVGVAKVDEGVRAGVVSVPHGHEGANVNVLTGKDEIDPVTGMARYCGIPVQVAPRAR
jgi:anaerobic selenocysteine-containing dehydrogenase